MTFPSSSTTVLLVSLLLIVTIVLLSVAGTHQQQQDLEQQQHPYQNINEMIGDPNAGAADMIHHTSQRDSFMMMDDSVFEASVLNTLASQSKAHSSSSSSPTDATRTIWKHFFNLSRIPRPSTDTARVNLYLREFANKHGFSIEEDSAQNVVIRVPATVPELVNAPSVVIQAHSDMVPEADQGIDFDFHRDAIRLMLSEDGQWLTANGTTLGADNGIGVAVALALATDVSVKRGPLELLITTDEEIGMVSAMKMKPGMLSSRFMINLDTDERDAFYIGCAGGVSNKGILSLKTELITDQSMTPYQLTVTGLLGGHSGVDIHLQRANAIKVMTRLLSGMQDESIEYQIVSINAGFAHNVIARQSFVTLVMQEKNESKLKSIVQKLLEEVKLEYAHTDPDLHIMFEKDSTTVRPITAFKSCCSKKLVRLLSALPHGVIRMSLDMPGLVETSTNLAVVKTEGNTVTIVTSQRSFIQSGKVDTAQSVQATFALAGADVQTEGDYPGWKPNPDSKIVKISKEVFRSKYGKDPRLLAIHAGLETGVFFEQYPDMDIIAFGPELQGAHSPSEKVKIEDVPYVYDLARSIIEHLSNTNR